mmetsp:Transcript_61149/g.163646  ORF Transcript_61149/g.163646 Transcript_61149/m.163646 type:complete len:319 (-) Transcript_61149:331-1287(-)
MAAYQAFRVRNTFIDIPAESSDCGSPVRKVKSDPLPQHWLDMMGFDHEADPDSEDGGMSPSPFMDRCDECGTSCSLDSDDDSYMEVSASQSTASKASFPLTPPSRRLVLKLESEFVPHDVGTARLEPVGHEQVGMHCHQQTALHLPPCPVPVVMPMVLVVPMSSSRENLQAVQPSPPSESTCISWTVNSDLVESSRNKVESEEFRVAVPGLGLQPFQIILYAVGNNGIKGTLGFERSSGQGRVEVRCLSQLPRGAGRFSMSIAVGDGERTQPARPLVPHDFSHRACCGWRRWDFRSAVNTFTQKVTVQISFLPPSACA